MKPETPQPASPQHRPEITYPCIWSYKVIGEDRQLLHEAILVSCAPDPVEISPSRVSRGGKYHSIEARLEVRDEAARNAIFERLKTHPAVKILF
jgi:putative lipoic acid-binding regulatory protein